MAKGRIRGEQIKDDSITGADVNEDTLLIKHVFRAKYTYTSGSSLIYIRWNNSGSNTSPGVNNRFVAPAAGTLKTVLIRSDGTPGSTEIGLHKASDGTEDVSETPVETQTVVMPNANTVATATFTDSASFSAGATTVMSI